MFFLCISKINYHVNNIVTKSFQAWRLWGEGKCIELIDPSIGSDSLFDEVTRCIKVGLLCVQEKPEARPTMSSVVLMLNNQKDASFCEPQQPGFVARRDLYYPHVRSIDQEPDSVNDISVSIDVGR